MNFLSPLQWDIFKATQKSAHDTYMTHKVIWLRSNHARDRWGEDNPNEKFEQIELRCLFNFNYLRIWPSETHSVSGSLDNDNIQMLVSKIHLADLGVLDGFGNFDYNPSADRFLINGKLYKNEGETDVSQAQTDNLLVSIILTPEIKPTTSIR